MIKIIYPHIPSKWGQELKYSIRSVEKHFTDPFEIIIVGDKPSYLNDKVQHIPEPANNSTIHLYKMDFLCNILPDNEDIIWIHDDIYLLRDINTQKLKTRWYSRDLADTKNTTNNKFIQQLYSTLEHLLMKGYLQISYECHIPRVFNIGQMRKTFEIFRGVPKWLLYTGYYNILENQPMHQIKGISAESYSRIKKSLPQITNRTLFLNHDDNGLSPVIKEFLYHKFPYKSQYEVQT